MNIWELAKQCRDKVPQKEWDKSMKTITKTFKSPAAELLHNYSLKEDMPDLIVLCQIAVALGCALSITFSPPIKTEKLSPSPRTKKLSQVRKSKPKVK